MKAADNTGADVLYEIALTLVAGIGPVRVRTLVAHCGSARQVFREKKTVLARLPEIGPRRAEAILRADVLFRADRELQFIARNGISAFFFNHADYPARLRMCADAPAVLFVKGHPDFANRHVLSIVGTRNATPYGRNFCEELIQQLTPINPVIVSGLAYGIDVCAHKAAIQCGLSTIACVAHGLDRIYPPLHADVARQMLERGGWVTEHLSGEEPERESFPMRNRIIAGLSDCTVVVESDRKGGSMLTAYLAEGYGRSVFALPGSIRDKYAQGTNLLIRKQVATLVTCADDLIEAMCWNQKGAPARQVSLFPELSAEEKRVYETIRGAGKAHVDTIGELTEMDSRQVAALLLELEFRGIVHSLPGKVYAAKE